MATRDDRPGMCVLGMHRSGTSLVASMLEELGAGFGDEDELIREHREHREIVAIDDALLREAGGTWDSPPVSAALAAVTGAPPDELRHRAADVLAGLRRRPVWGFKDPRATLTWPFWRRAAVLRPVVCLRHPDAVARSLARRDRFPGDKSLWLWARHLSAVLTDLVGDDAMLVVYEDLVADPQATVDRLVAYGGLDPPPGGAERAARLVRAGTHDPPGAAPGPSHVAREAYDIVREAGLDGAGAALALVRDIDADLGDRFSESWGQRTERMLATIAEAVPRGAAVAVVGDASLAIPSEVDGNRVLRVDLDPRGTPGPPADDAGACVRLARAQQAGATHVAIPWTSSWWLDRFPGFARTVRAGRVVVSDERVTLVALRLRPARSTRQGHLRGGE